MAIDIGDEPVLQVTDLSNTSIMGLKNGVQTVRIPVDLIGTGSSSAILDLDGGSASNSNQITIDIDGGGA